MILLTSSLISLLILSNSIIPSFLPKDGFFSMSAGADRSESGQLSRLNNIKLPLKGVEFHKEIQELKPVLGLQPPEKLTTSTPEINAQAGVVRDVYSSRALWRKKQNKSFPIASITKLMTALVFLETSPDWESYYKITEKDRREGGKIYLFLGERVKVKDLFKTSLVASANTATAALVHSTGLTEEEFARKMNRKAKVMGFKKTYFKDATGLNSENISTAWEISKFTQVALEKDRIREAVSLPEYEFETKGGREKEIKSTDDLLKFFPVEGMELIGGKTGYNEEAGYCFVGGFQNDGNYLISVVLGAESKKERFSLTEELIKWSYKSYKW